MDIGFCLGIISGPVVVVALCFGDFFRDPQLWYGLSRQKNIDLCGPNLIQRSAARLLFFTAQCYPHPYTPDPKQGLNKLRIALDEALFCPYLRVGGVWLGVVFSTLRLPGACAGCMQLGGRDMRTP